LIYTWAYYKAPVVADMGGTVLMTVPPSPGKPSDPVELARRDVVLANRILASDDMEVLDTLGTARCRFAPR